MENQEEYARERFELNRQKQTLKEQQQQRPTVTYNGGIFKVDMQLLSYLYMKCANVGLFQASREDILLDSYDTPIKTQADAKKFIIKNRGIQYKGLEELVRFLQQMNIVPQDKVILAYNKSTKKYKIRDEKAIQSRNKKAIEKNNK